MHNPARSNQFSESWISQHPVLFFVYLNNYFPTLTKGVASKIGNKKVRKAKFAAQQPVYTARDLSHTRHAM